MTGKLLIVDDEDDLREMLAEMMTEEGLAVITAIDGVDALEKILADHNGTKEIFAILSDINMPRLNGLDLLKELNNHQINTPFIVLTGYSDHEKIRTALKYGAYDLLDKPFQRNVLLSCVQSAFDFGREMKRHEFELDKLMNTTSPLTAEQTEQVKTQIEKMTKLKFERKNR
jgi:DNA-binding NtrC family response regulator